MMHRITGYLPRGRIGRLPPAPARPAAPPRPVSAQPRHVLVEREKTCRACEWYDGRCQHPYCPTCPGRQILGPWVSVRACPVGKWK